ncbi:NAD(P)H-dependent flavin oxidoreductase [Enterococcus sp.]|uniref:NAD(P)H-dependent flavin oxidoreductase n=1 Tax=Enterococcus sp. TaxID=35783 RepID=UPI001F95BC7A|nr:nitronate monooxygenase family protein [Candidatus Enterococcus stercoravium]
MPLPQLTIGDLKPRHPIIQGGMGIGVSLARLAGAVAKAGGIGIISCAQIGYQHPRFQRAPLKANLEAIATEYQKAKEIAGPEGIVGFNIMCAMNKYEKYVQRCVEVGADVIISGAGLPIHLPELVGEAKTKIAPIVSSAKAAKILLRTWAKRYQRTADFVVVEGPQAGGHLGFKYEDTAMKPEQMDEEFQHILKEVAVYEEQFQRKIPVIFAGGVFDRKDIDHYFQLGASGVQMASRFVVTEECDAPESYKKMYLNAQATDVEVIKSPVGMPGRALKNRFTERTKVEAHIPIAKCRSCLSYDHCDRKTIPYCITEMLLNAVTDQPEDGLVFAGGQVHRIKKMTTVPELMAELTEDN